ncbi:type II CRISPR-associated endonuclease Cas1 [Sporocytophaga myxococcoides]|uniref:type II CRISPR-associated endonuclease Cas1 n=1 Tax=Sporocytophaga myxococcoides TaxID=153721 RepID=UPI0004020330|nr:type II CRISPR-associated endonuclease Cas1 [Sporocytophaga myxococcoides]
MIKKTLYFGNPAYLNTRDEQLVINFPGAKGIDDLTKMNTVPIEDIGVVILDHQQITISHSLMAKLLANNAALITCDHTHHPTGLMLNLDGNQLQSARFKTQADATLPLKKQLWQQTVKQKIFNQALLLKKNGINHENLLKWADDVKSGDSDNLEARAAVFYWKNLFSNIQLIENSSLASHLIEFKREREGHPPNNLLNYGYAILRAIVARSLTGSGLLPTLGIYHRNQYNAYCLADDIMEPYRPYVDSLVYSIIKNGEDFTELTNSTKKQLLSIPTMDVVIDEEKSPLMIGVQRTTSSLAKCFEGKLRKIAYPRFI